MITPAEHNVSTLATLAKVKREQAKRCTEIAERHGSQALQWELRADACLEEAQRYERLARVLAPIEVDA